jgi:hypothetical protein
MKCASLCDPGDQKRCHVIRQAAHTPAVLNFFNGAL